MNEQAIKLFEEKKVRTLWNETEEEWYFSVVDVVAVLTESPRPRKYWNALKTKLNAEGSEVSHNLGHLKLLSEDGKMRLTDVANVEQLFRLIQSIPSPKAEPFKQWLAHIAKERIDQLQDPELSIEQAMLDYKRLGYSDNWINQNSTSPQPPPKEGEFPLLRRGRRVRCNGLKAQNILAWGNALRYEIAGQARNDGKKKQTATNCSQLKNDIKLLKIKRIWK